MKSSFDHYDPDELDKFDAAREIYNVDEEDSEEHFEETFEEMDEESFQPEWRTIRKTIEYIGTTEEDINSTRSYKRQVFRMHVNNIEQ